MTMFSQAIFPPTNSVKPVLLHRVFSRHSFLNNLKKNLTEN